MKGNSMYDIRTGIMSQQIRNCVQYIANQRNFIIGASPVLYATEVTSCERATIVPLLCGVCDDRVPCFTSHGSNTSVVSNKNMLSETIVSVNGNAAW